MLKVSISLYRVQLHGVHIFFSSNEHLSNVIKKSSASGAH